MKGCLSNWVMGVLAALSLLITASPASAYTGPDEWIFIETGDATSLNPLRDQTTTGDGVFTNVFDQLADFEGPELKLVPKLAVSWDNPSPNQWRFKLRQGVRFHDGSEFTAADVKFTFDAAADAKSVRRINTVSIERTDVIDKYTVMVTTNKPIANMVSILSALFILPKATYERLGDEGFAKAPVGTGRYKLVQWDRGQRIVMETNDAFWGKKDQPKRLIVRPIAEPTTRLAELRTGRAQVVKGLPVEAIAELEKDPVAKIVPAKGIRQIFYPLNTLRKPLNDVRVRRALNYAVDREAIVKYVLDGRGEIRTGPMNPRAWGFNPKTQGYTYNPEMAKRLLAEAGYSNGLEMTWNMTRGTYLKDAEIAEAVANQLGKVGVRVKLNFLERGTLFQKYYDGDFDASVTAWSLTADPDNLYTGLRIYSPASKWYRNPEVDKLLEKGRETVDSAQRLKVYQDLYEVLVQDAPWLMIHAQDENYGVNRKVEWKPYPFLGIGGNTYFTPMVD